MKIIVFGGNGLIGTKLVGKLRKQGHEVAAASQSTGVDILSRAGVAEVLKGAEVAVDVTNSPSFEDAAALKFFETSARNVLPAEAAAGVKHHVALSVVGADRTPNIGYMRAKVAQETAIKASGIPYTILRATQFFEFIGQIVDGSTVGDTVRASSVLMQPVAANDVAAALAGIAVSKPLNGIRELAGPDPLRLDELARRYLIAHHDSRKVIPDARKTYFGADVDDRSITPGENPLIGPTRFGDWLKDSQEQAGDKTKDSGARAQKQGA